MKSPVWTEGVGGDGGVVSDRAERRQGVVTVGAWSLTDVSAKGGV